MYQLRPEHLRSMLSKLLILSYTSYTGLLRSRSDGPPERHKGLHSQLRPQQLRLKSGLLAS